MPLIDTEKAWKTAQRIYSDPVLLHAIKNVLSSTEIIEAAPVVHGEWHDAKFVRAYKGTNLLVVQCSKCECYFCDVINNHHFMYHYCPNCGARMDGDGGV